MPQAQERWRRWVLILLGIQSLLLVCIVVALWPLVAARLGHSGDRPMQAAYFVTRQTGETPAIYASPALTGEPVCRLHSGHHVYLVPFAWSWPRLLAAVWYWRAVEVLVDADEARGWNSAVVGCRGFADRTQLFVGR